MAKSMAMSWAQKADLDLNVIIQPKDKLSPFATSFGIPLVEPKAQ